MRFFRYLNEDYLCRIESPYDGDSFEVFVNPSSKELRDASNNGKDEVRFLADFQYKKLYIWHSDYTHADFLIDLPRKYKIGDPEKVSMGLAALRGNKLEFTQPDGEAQVRGQIWPRMNDKWLSKWFIEPYVATYKDYVDEEYLDTMDKYGSKTTLTDIYVDPDSTDLKKLYRNGGKDLRFAADNTKKNIYVWNAWVATHDDAMTFLKSQGYIRKEVVCGYANNMGNKMAGKNFAWAYTYDIDEEELKKAMGWIAKYIKGNYIVRPAAGTAGYPYVEFR